MIIKCPHCQQDHDFNYGQYMAARRQAKPNSASAATSRANGQKRKPAYKVEIYQSGTVDWTWRVIVKRKVVAVNYCATKQQAEQDSSNAIKELISKDVLVAQRAD